MSHINATHVGAALIIVVLVITASLSIISVNLLVWPLSGNSAGQGTQSSVIAGQGLLLINATFSNNGIQNPVTGAQVTLYSEPENVILTKFLTDPNGMASLPLDPHSYYVSIQSQYGTLATYLTIEPKNTTVITYSVSYETSAVFKFEIVTSQPNLVAPWDSVYVALPSYTRAFIATQLFIELSSPSNSSPIPSSIVSEETLPTETGFTNQYVNMLWVQLKPDDAFSSANMTSMQILTYNSTITLTIYSGFIQVR